jgi:hypothetical protein
MAWLERANHITGPDMHAEKVVLGEVATVKPATSVQ